MMTTWCRSLSQVGCYSPDSLDGARCTRQECLLVHNYTGYAGRSNKKAWASQMTHYDNVYAGLLCLFEMATTEV